MDASAAGRWFGLQAESEVQSWDRRILGLLKQLGLAVLTLGLSLVDYNPRRFCDVVVYRRSDGFPLLHYSYDNLGEAELHLARLRTMLNSAEVGAFCHELGISRDLVVGDGDSEIASAEIERIETPTDHRRRYWPTVPAN